MLSVPPVRYHDKRPDFVVFVGHGHVGLVADESRVRPLLAAFAGCRNGLCLADDPDNVAEFPFPRAKVFDVAALAVDVVAQQSAELDFVPRAVSIFKASGKKRVELFRRDVFREFGLELLNGFCSRWRVICRLGGLSGRSGVSGRARLIGRLVFRGIFCSRRTGAFAEAPEFVVLLAVCVDGVLDFAVLALDGFRRRLGKALFEKLLQGVDEGVFGALARRPLKRVLSGGLAGGG